jgi:hypothetical protein
VLGGVGQQFGGAEVGDGLDRRGRAGRQAAGQQGGDGAAGGQAGQGVRQAVVQHRRVDAPGQFAEFAEGVAGALQGGVDQFAGGVGVRHCTCVAELLLRPAQVHRQRGEPDLRAVVQVAFEPPQPGGGVVDRQRPGPFQVRQPPGRRPGAEQPADQPPVGGYHGPGHPRGRQQHAGPGREGGERAGEGRDGEATVAEPVERRDDRHRAEVRARGMAAERLPPERVGQVGQPGTPEHRDGVQLQQHDGQLQKQVRQRPPGCPVRCPALLRTAGDELGRPPAPD